MRLGLRTKEYDQSLRVLLKTGAAEELSIVIRFAAKLCHIKS